jgi:hypothetical protein
MFEYVFGIINPYEISTYPSDPITALPSFLLVASENDIASTQLLFFNTCIFQFFGVVLFASPYYGSKHDSDEFDNVP